MASRQGAHAPAGVRPAPAPEVQRQSWRVSQDREGRRRAMTKSACSLRDLDTGRAAYSFAAYSGLGSLGWPVRGGVSVPDPAGVDGLAVGGGVVEPECFGDDRGGCL